MLIWKNNPNPLRSNIRLPATNYTSTPPDTRSLYVCWLRSTTMTRIPKKAIFSLCGPFNRGCKTSWLSPLLLTKLLCWLTAIFLNIDISVCKTFPCWKSSRKFLSDIGGRSLKSAKGVSKGGAGSVRRQNVIFLYNPYNPKTSTCFERMWLMITLLHLSAK